MHRHTDQLILIHFQNSRSFHQFQKFHFTKTACESWYKVYFAQIQNFQRTLMCICVLQSISPGFKRKSSGSNRPRLLQCGHGILREGWEIMAFRLFFTWQKPGIFPWKASEWLMALDLFEVGMNLWMCLDADMWQS